MLMIWMGFHDFDNCANVHRSNVSFTAVPYNSDTNLHVLSMGGMGMHIAANSPNAALASRVAAWITGYDGQLQWAAGGGFTVRKSVSLNPSFLSDPATGKANVLNGVFLADFPLVKDFYRLPIYSKLLAVSQYWLNEAILGRTTSAAALENMAVAQQALIDVYYPCGVKSCFQPSVQVDALMSLLGFIVSLAGVWTSSMLAEDLVFLKRGSPVHALMLATSSGLLAFAGVWAMPLLAIASITLKYTDLHGAQSYPTSINAGILAASLAACLVLCAMGLICLFVLNRRSGFWQARTRGSGKYAPESSLNSVSSVSVSAEGALRTGEEQDSTAAPQIHGVGDHLRALEASTLLGAALITAALQLTFFLLQRAVVSDVSVASNAGMVVVSVIVCLTLVVTGSALLVQTRSGSMRFLACALLAVAVVLTFVLGMKASSFSVASVKRPVGDAEMQPLEIGVLVSATLLCLSFIGLNASRLQLSRNALTEILARVQRQMERDVSAAKAVAAFESAERMRVARLFEVMCLARPLLSAATMAMALTEVSSIAKPEKAAKPTKSTNDARGKEAGTLVTPGAKSGPPPQITLASAPPACVRDESLVVSNLNKIESALLNPLPSSVLSRIQLSDVLAHPVAAELLKDHLRSLHQEESLTFLQALSAYRSLTTPEARLQVALALSKSFVDDGAAHQVNISHDQRAHIQASLQSRQAPQDLFALVELEMIQLMQLNAWASFTEKPAFKFAAMVLEHPSFRLSKQVKNVTGSVNSGATDEGVSMIDGGSHTLHDPASLIELPSRAPAPQTHDSHARGSPAPNRARHPALMQIVADDQLALPGVSSTGTPSSGTRAFNARKLSSGAAPESPQPHSPIQPHRSFSGD